MGRDKRRAPLPQDDFDVGGFRNGDPDNVLESVM
jgi:hypothetical protein